MSPAPDFLQPTRRPHRLAWAACATALAVLAVASLDALEAAAALAEASTPVRDTTPHAAPPAPATAQAQRAIDDTWRALDRPWHEAFRSIEALPARGLTWMALRIDPAGALHLEGQAADSATALGAAALLRRHQGWRDVVLGRMERTGDGALAFEINATWAGASR